MTHVFIYRNKNLSYPMKEDAFSPSAFYAEYMWSNVSKGISGEDNAIYAAIRKLFYEQGFDIDHYNTKEWNPLGKMILPGNTVLVKPNMVKHINETIENGTECLYTHPSLIRVVVDYVLIALKGKGRVVIADAPVQSCDFDALYANSGYGELIEFYKQCGVDVKIYDLRKEIASIENGIVVRRENKSSYNDICINLGNRSSFCELTESQIQNLRITDYSPLVMNEHHTKEMHEYSISRIVIEADVIINMPKIKTHRLGGITAALKNMVGINARKDYLPHHRMGARSEGGDQFQKNSLTRSIVNRFTDRRNELIEEGKYSRARIADIFVKAGWKLFRLGKSKDAFIGNWSGNDTIWRMVSDLNKIVFYCDKFGTIRETAQRKMLIIGDMVIAGEGEGPLNPSPVKANCILMGTNPVIFDMAASKIMGYEYENLPVISNNFLMKNEYFEATVNSNDPILDGKRIDMLPEIYHFEKPNGWK